MQLPRACAFLTLAVTAVPLTTLSAQQAPVVGMRPSDAARCAIVGAKVLVSPGVTLEKATILIRDGIIEAIGAEIATPAGYRVFDGAGKTVFAGFIESALVIDSTDAQSAALRAVGAHWNQNVTPEVSGTALIIPDATLESLRAQGFTIARLLPEDGIFRGSSDLRLLAKTSERVLARELGGVTVQLVGPVTRDFSQFMGQTPVTPGVSTPSNPFAPGARGDRDSRFPSSLMGSYALMRQTFMDAAWRRDCLAANTATTLPVEDQNALDALQPLLAGTHGIIIDASDELEAARMMRLAQAQAPNAPLTVLGSGLEFRGQQELVALAANMHAAFIIPIEFPQAPDLVSPMASDSMSLRDLMTWRYAPTNPKRLIEAGSTVVLSSHRMSDKSGFRRKLADAITHGLTKDQALAALTTTPAKLLGIDARAGTIEAGKLANLIIAAGDPFDAETKFEGIFVAGAPVMLPPDAPVLAAGSFTVTALDTTAKPLAKDLRIVLDPKDSSLKATWTPEAPAADAKPVEAAAVEVAKPAEDVTKPATNNDAPASDAASAESKVEEKKDVAGSATAKRAGISDGRAWGMFDGAPFGFEGEIRVSLAGTGATATMTIETATGARAAFALVRVVEEAKKDDTKTDAKTDAKNDDVKKDDAAPAAVIVDANNPSEPTTQDTKTSDAAVTDDNATPSPNADRPARDQRGGRGMRGQRGGDGNAPSKIGEAGKNGEASDEKKPDERETLWKDVLPFPFGEYGRIEKPLAGTVVVKDATVWTLGAQGIIKDGDMLIRDGKIIEVALDIAVPEGATVIDGKGKHITPGLIDCHSHTGISGGVNEGSQSCTAEVWIGDCIDPTDINWYRQLAGGLVAVNQLHGSANPIGGRNSVVKIRWGEGAEAFRFEGAPSGIKFALGENVTRSSSRYPSSRMGVKTFLQDSFLAAREYRARQVAYAAAPVATRGLPPRTDLELETLAEILEGSRLVHCHSYRQDEILMLLRTAEQFGFRVATLQHVLEGYKLAGEIAKHGAGASSFSDWWAYKVEVMDAIPWNGALMHKAGVLVSFNSDSDELARRLNMEAAKAVRYGGLSPEEALKLVTLNPAKQLKIDARTGSLEVGKDADFVLWSGDPLSAFTHCDETWIDGARRYSRIEDDAVHAQVIRTRGELIAKATTASDRAGAGARAGGGGAAGGPGGGGGRRGRGAPTLMERMLESREDTIWLRIARGMEPLPKNPGDCGCGETDAVPVEELRN